MIGRARASIGIAALGVALAAGLGPPARTALQGASESSVVALAVPGRANAHVSLASSGSVVVAAWSAAVPGGETNVFAAASRDSGRTFSAPVRVNAKPGEARVNGEQPPRVALARVVTTSERGRVSFERISVIWTAKGATGTMLLTAQSDDLGQTFGASTLVAGTDTAGNRGWEAVGADSSGRVHAVWLDHRRMAAATAERAPSAHKHKGGEGSGAASGGVAPAVKPDGVAMAQQSDLYFDTLADAVAPRAITPGVCYCCKTAMAFGAPDRIFLAWRHVYQGNFRDIAFAASADGGRTFSAPTRVSQDHWMLEGCPDDGPAMAVDPKGRVHVVWPAVVTEGGATPTKALFYAQTTDGFTFTPRQRIPTDGQANHPQVSVRADGTLQVAWDEAGGGKRTIVLGRGVLDRSGRATFTRLSLNETGVYPVVAATSGGALVAWTAGAPNESVIKVARVQ